MRWESLFSDLDAQMEELEASELASEVADRTRREVARFRLVDRLRPTFGHPVTVFTLGGGKLSGRVAGVGSDWLLVADDRRFETLVPLEAITGITGLGGLTASPGSEGKVAARLTLGYALRGIARDRAAGRHRPSRLHRCHRDDRQGRRGLPGDGRARGGGDPA